MAMPTLAAHDKIRILLAWQASGLAPSGISVGTLRRWEAAVRGRPREEWPEILAPRYRGRVALAEIPAPAWDYFRGIYLTLLAPGAAECHRRTVREAARQGWGEVPAAVTFLRRIRREYQPAEIILAREGQEALDRLYPAQRRTVADLEPLQVLNADGLRLDLFVRWEDGSIGRPHIWTWQDVYSRLPLAWEVARNEHTCQIRRSYGEVLARYGLWCGAGGPHVVVDNTRAAANKAMSGGLASRRRFGPGGEDEAAGIFRAFGVAVHWTSIEAWGGRGQAKPVERLHQEMQAKIARAPECEGAYTGANTTAKPEDYATRAVPEAVLRRVVAREMEAIATQAGRRTEMAAGEASLREVFLEGYHRAQAEGRIRQVTEAERRLYLLEAATLRVRQPAEVILHGNRYWAENLIAHAGRDIVVRYDADHLQDGAWAYTLTGKLIGELRCIEATGFLDRDAARDHQRARRQWRKSVAESLAARQRMARTAPGSTYLPETDSPEHAEAVPISPPRDTDTEEREERVARRLAAACRRLDRASGM